MIDGAWTVPPSFARVGTYQEEGGGKVERENKVPNIALPYVHTKALTRFQEWWEFNCFYPVSYYIF